MKNNRKILVVDDEEITLKVLSEELISNGFSADIAENGEQAIDKIKFKKYDLILLDNKMPKKNGIDVMKEIKKQEHDNVVIMMTAYGTINDAVEVMKLGAYDYITKPFDINDLIKKIKRIFESENSFITRVDNNSEETKLIGSSKEIIKIKRMINKVKDIDVSVLITGESGTGKGVVAREIHELSNRNNKPFIHVNCSVLPDNLIESELFGHSKGAFTGANENRRGKFEAAGEGTIFLDEISTLNYDLQAKLLLVLEEKKFEKIGSTETIPLKARLITATNSDLEKQIKAGKFREDLYYRLKVINIECPPLRHRKEDIKVLTMFFVNNINKSFGKNIKKISDNVWNAFENYNWPGNVRELKNILESSIALSNGNTIMEDDLPLELMRKIKEIQLSSEDSNLGVLHTVETDAIKEALQRNNGHRQKTANELGISRRALQYKLKELKESHIL